MSGGARLEARGRLHSSRPSFETLAGASAGLVPQDEGGVLGDIATHTGLILSWPPVCPTPADETHSALILRSLSSPWRRQASRRMAAGSTALLVMLRGACRRPPISGLPEIGAIECASRLQPTCAGDGGFLSMRAELFGCHFFLGDGACDVVGDEKSFCACAAMCSDRVSTFTA